MYGVLHVFPEEVRVVQQFHSFHQFSKVKGFISLLNVFILVANIPQRKQKRGIPSGRVLFGKNLLDK